MESIMMLMFKPGFTIKPIKDPEVEIKYLGIDDRVIWESGISISIAENSKIRTYDTERAICLRLLLTMLS